MKQTNGQQIIQIFESWSPKKIAAKDGDPIGLAIGTLNKPVSNVLVTLDVNEAVVDEAIENGCELIIAHHPPIFRKLANIRTDLPKGKLIEKCIKNDIAVYAAHTNLDVAEGGVNDLLADALQLKNCEVLVPTFAEKMYKLAVYVPVDHAEMLRQALAGAGAGQIGDYDSCSYTVTGEGRYRALDGAHPFLGEVGKLHTEPEVKIEVVVAESSKNKVLRAMLNHHPYEEPAYDLFVLETPAKEMGLGRIGTVATMSLKEFAEHVKKTLNVPKVRVVGDLNSMIKKVAVLGGDGNKYIYDAKRAGADVFVTGDMYFHVAQDAESLGLHIVDPGHHVESVMKVGVVEKMTKLCAHHKVECVFIPSKLSTEPFQFI
ncbi:Nif3-like dinuclear metal center hexameric protein [Rummeliibacillus pycnus]|uniref:Nif3-like dinuclear metal center hexameric protein n=1 Tax=Rummeliibacillus pycnus TaxID=101070 RepID=UPI000C9CFFC5|nr:Nif3-like dinuclear metal center hexameric protein [Rummeliibacillus pycnus]